MEAEHRGLVEASEVTNSDSQYPEWRLLGPTGASQQFLQETRPSKRVWALVVVIGGAIAAFLAWLIPILANLYKH
jgi:hypothetical protein